MQEGKDGTSLLPQQHFGVELVSDDRSEQFDIACVFDFASEQHLRLHALLKTAGP